MGTGENFLNRTPMAQALKLKIDKWDLMRLQSFCKAKDTQENKTAAQRVVKDLYQPHIRYRLYIQGIQRTQKARHQKIKQPY